MCQQQLLDLLTQLRKNSNRYYNVKEIRQLMIDSNIVPPYNIYAQLNKLADYNMIEVMPRPIKWNVEWVLSYRGIKRTNSVEKHNSKLVYK